MVKDRFEAARECARLLLHRFGVTKPEHIRVEAFAGMLGIKVVDDVRLNGADAQLVRTKKCTTLLISNHIVDPAARRFCIAHELGHFLLGTEHSFSRPGSIEEREVNVFGSELLMPAPMLQPLCAMPPIDLSAPRQIVRDHQVSILTSAIRVTELSPEPCAAVLSEAGRVKWCAASPTFPQRIDRGTPLHPSSLAFGFFDKGTLDEQPRRGPATTWFPTWKNGEVVEHATCSRELGTVLSMLWVPEDARSDLQLNK